MRELWPTPTDDLDIGTRLAGDVRSKPDGRPWVMMVMITSLDGSIAVDGVSGGLGSPADQQRFIAARHLADGIIVGATTAAVEDYRPSQTPIAIVSGSLSPDPKARLFGDPDRKPLVFTTARAAASRGGDFDGVAEIISLGESVSPAAVLADLDGRGMRVVVLEGGPTLNGSFVEADLVDELLLSFSPLIVGGDGPGFVSTAPLGLDRRFELQRVLTDDDLIFASYLRRR